jgi:hypothetical protein
MPKDKVEAKVSNNALESDSEFELIVVCLFAQTVRNQLATVNKSIMKLRRSLEGVSAVW